MNTTTTLTDFNNLTPELIKKLPEYRLTKIDLLKKYFILQDRYDNKLIKEQELKGLVEGLTKQLEDKSEENKMPNSNLNIPEGSLPLILTEPEQEVNIEIHKYQEEYENLQAECNILKEENEKLKKENEELKEKIDKCDSTLGSVMDQRNTAYDERDKYQKENKALKEKINHIENIMNGLRNLLTPGF